MTNVLNGYNGEILRVDLSSGVISVDKPDKEFYRKYIGGRGFISYFLLRELKGGEDALGPENKLIFAGGAVTGVPVGGGVTPRRGGGRVSTRRGGSRRGGGRVITRRWGSRRGGWRPLSGTRVTLTMASRRAVISTVFCTVLYPLSRTISRCCPASRGSRAGLTALGSPLTRST